MFSQLEPRGEMAREFYDDHIALKMRELYDNLSEKDRRRYAAIEAKKLPYGGVTYIAKLFECSRRVIYDGLADLEELGSIPQDRIRRLGGGRKKVIDQMNGLSEAFLESLKNNTAGDPMNEGIIWTDLTPREISVILTKNNFKVGTHVVKQLLKKHGYVQRSAAKKESIGSSENRDEQFLNIDQLRRKYEDDGNPVLSIDTKKRVFR